MASLINIGLSGLQAQQTALAVTGQNISNASTPGYSRQTPEIVSQVAGMSGAFFVGAGARVQDIERVVDQFVSSQLRSDTALFAELDTLAGHLTQIEGLLADESSGLDPALNAFFGALQAAANNPGSLPERQLVISEAQGLARRFASLHGRLTEQLGGVDTTLRAATERANELAAGVADINDRIATASTTGNNGAMNSLLDQRDALIEELSTIVSVSVIAGPGGQVGVMIGKGQPLVLGGDAGRLSVTGQGGVLLDPSGRGEAVAITAGLSGGQIGGVLQLREAVIEPALDRLGHVAVVLADSMNSVHALGLDLNGAPGGLFFSDPNDPAAVGGRVIAHEGNAAGGATRVDVYIDDASTDFHNYQLVFPESGDGAFFVRRDTDGEIVFQGQLSGELPQTVSFDNLTMVLEHGQFQAGDRFSIQPLRDAARHFAVSVSRPEALAFAGPIRAERNLANAGDAQIVAGQVIDAGHPIFSQDGVMSPPLLIRFTSATTYDVLDNSDPARPRALDPPLTGLRYQAGVDNDLLPTSTGQTLVFTDGADIGRLPTQAAILTGLDQPGNGYAGESVTVTRVDPATGAKLGTQTVTFDAGASARSIADELSTLTGVQASATSELTLGPIVDNGIGTPLDVAVNGVLVQTQTPLTPASLADAINANETLSADGIVAVSDGGAVLLKSVHGENLSVHVAGDPTDSITFTDRSGGVLVLNGVGPGVAATVSGTVDVSSGFDFESGGPYRFSMGVGGGPAQVVELVGTHPSGASLASAVQASVDQALGANRVQVSLTAGGQLRFTTVGTGAEAGLTLSGIGVSNPVAGALGLGNTSAFGENAYRVATVGGQVAAVLSDGLSLTGSALAAGSVFPGNIEAHRADLGFTLNMTGSVAAGDTFAVDFNGGASSDNRVALQMSNLATTALVGDPPRTYAEAYGELVQFVGVTASQTNINRSAAQSLLNQTRTARESVSGVNLDEEAANLIRFEQGYNAAAQVISVARDTFDILLNAVS